jgi:hypothetical protein
MYIIFTYPDSLISFKKRNKGQNVSLGDIIHEPRGIRKIHYYARIIALAKGNRIYDLLI